MRSAIFPLLLSRGGYPRLLHRHADDPINAVRRDIDKVFKNLLAFDLTHYEDPRKLAHDMWRRVGGVLEDARESSAEDLSSSKTGGNGSHWSPRSEFRETDKDFLTQCELPGVSVDQIKVDVEGNNLTVKGELQKYSHKEEAQIVRTERRFGKFLRSFFLAGLNKTEPKDIAATYKAGLLSMRVPKKEPDQQPKRVSIPIANADSTPAP
mmetsp:Transcript_20748/g.35646  ORF Transcript_20748/g.35646 Transcript_20748/m.35646 type:complete len:209 (-) Transcript_20748:2-628(-)